jgi:hypothetical protein
VGRTPAKIRYSRFCSLMTRKEVRELDNSTQSGQRLYIVRDMRSNTRASTPAHRREWHHYGLQPRGKKTENDDLRGPCMSLGLWSRAFLAHGKCRRAVIRQPLINFDGRFSLVGSPVVCRQVHNREVLFLESFLVLQRSKDGWYSCQLLLQVLIGAFQ